MMRSTETPRRQRRPRRVRVRPINGLSFNKMIPNILTLLALCAGMTAIRFAISGRFESAVIAIIIAGVLDGLDGRVARLLKASSSWTGSFVQRCGKIRACIEETKDRTGMICQLYVYQDFPIHCDCDYK